jgi:hypothetical protein
MRWFRARIGSDRPRRQAGGGRDGFDNCAGRVLRRGIVGSPFSNPRYLLGPISLKP